MTESYIQKRKKPFWVLTAGEVSLLLLVIMVSSLKYEVSDDFVMEMVLSGVYTGKPDPHIMFSNVLWGMFLLPFYKISSIVSWYFVFQILICLLSYIALVYVVTDQMQSWIACAALAVFTLFTAMDLYILPQFTKTAMAAVVSGSIVFYYSLCRKKSLWVTLAGFILIIFGLLIRLSVVYIAAPFIVIYVFGHILVLDKNVNYRYKIAIVLCSLVLFWLIINGSMFLDRHAYTEPAYAYFKQYSSVRSKIIDYPKPPKSYMESELVKLGFTSNDYSMILNWCFADQKVFSLEKMKALLEVISDYRSVNNISIRSILGTIKNRKMLVYPGTLCCVTLGLISIINNSKRIWFLFLDAAIVVGFCCLFPALGRNVYRVEFCCFYGAAAIILCSQNTSDYKPAKVLAVCLLSFFTLVYQLRLYLPDNTFPGLDTQEYRDYIDNTLFYSGTYDSEKYKIRIIPYGIHTSFINTVKEHPENLYILDFFTTIQTLYYDIPPYISAASAFPKNALYLSGVTVNHPGVDEYIHSLGYRDPLAALLEKNVYLVDNGTQDLIVIFFREHGHPNAELIENAGLSGYNIWTISDSKNES